MWFPERLKWEMSGCISGSTLPELLVLGLAHPSRLFTNSTSTIHKCEVCILPCSKKARTSEWDTTEATPSVSRWDATPGRADEFGATPGRGGATPGLTPGHSRWDATPTPGRAGTEATPRRNRWDDATPTPGRVRLSPRIPILALSNLVCSSVSELSWKLSHCHSIMVCRGWRSHRRGCSQRKRSAALSCVWHAQACSYIAALLALNVPMQDWWL